MFKKNHTIKAEQLLEDNELLQELAEDTIIPPSIISLDSDRSEVANDGTTFALSNELIDAPFAIALNRKHLSALAIQIMDISIAAMDKRLFKLRADIYASNTYCGESSSFLIETAKSEMKEQFRGEDKRTIRLTNAHISSILNTKNESNANLNTTHTARTIRSLIDAKFAFKRVDDEDATTYFEDINVFEKVRIGVGSKSTVKDAFLVFSLSFLEQILGIASYTRFSLAHHYKLKSMYAARTYKLLVSRAMRSRYRSSSKQVFQVVKSVSNWRMYLDLCEKVEVRIGTICQLEEFAAKKGLLDRDSTVLVTNATDLLSSEVKSMQMFKNLSIEGQDTVLASYDVLLTNIGQNLEKDDFKIQEKLENQSALVYRNMPYPLMAKLKKEVFEKSIMGSINAFPEGGIKIKSLDFIKKGRNITSIKINYMISPEIFGRKLVVGGDEERLEIEHNLDEALSSRWDIEGDVPF